MTIPHFIDSHCHLDCLSPAIELPAVITESRQVGVIGWVVPGIEPAGWQTISSLAATNVGVFPAYGVHPLWADQWSEETAARLQQCAMLAVAIGEIGLDYSAKAPDRKLQQCVFRAQLRIARVARLPVLIHCRHAFADLLAICKSEGVVERGGIMHAFSGSLEIARECMRLGLLLGIAGPVTYANARRLPEVVAAVGLPHLVLETDSPDLTPVPLRGAANVPAHLLIIARRVAALTGASLAEVATVTTENLRRLLALSID
jgi:TatD DNase family protein